jgi:hypothetical protein
MLFGECSYPVTEDRGYAIRLLLHAKVQTLSEIHAAKSRRTRVAIPDQATNPR